MKIVQLTAENVKKIKAISIDSAFDNVIKITGANEQGKTTVLDCIMYALAGKGAIQEMPIRTGEKKARIVLDLGDMVVTRTFTEKGSYLNVENRDNSPLKKTAQALLDDLLSKFTFDPLAFSKAKKPEQMETLLQILGLQVDYNKLNAMAGFDVEQSDNVIDVFASTIKRIYNQRTDKNRELDSAKKIYTSLATVEKAEPVQITELVEQRDKVLAGNQENQKKRDGIGAYEQRLADTTRDLLACERDIEELEGKLNRLRNQKDGLNGDVALRQREYNEYKKAVEALQDQDTFDLDAQIFTADEQNKQAQQWLDRERAREKYEYLLTETVAMSNRLNEIGEYKEELIKSAKFPVEGLSFSDTGILYQGVPFEQASSAQRLQVSLAVAMALNPTLRVIRIDDGSLLDSKHMAVIEDMARDNDYQIWMEMVDETGKVGIYIEDGEIVKGAN